MQTHPKVPLDIDSTFVLHLVESSDIILAKQMKESTSERHDVGEESPEIERPPELSIKPLVDLLSRLVQEPPWPPSGRNAVAEARMIDHWVYEKTEEVVTWLQTVEKCCKAAQALIQFKVENLPRKKDARSSKP